MLRYECNGMKLQIIDGRTLTIVVKPEIGGRTTTQEAVESEVVSIFKTLLYYDYLCDKSPEVKIAATKPDGTDAYYGSVQYDRGKCAGWIQSDSIEWWSDGTCIVFDIKKFIVPPPSKVQLDGNLYVGGIPYSDQRVFARFDPKNRIDFTKEFKEQILRTTNAEVDTKSTKGKVKAPPAAAK